MQTKWAAGIALLLSLEYAVGKLVMAARGELGVPGHPAPPEATERFSGDITTAQLGNASLGFAMAALALAFLLRRGPRWLLALGALASLVGGIAGAAVVLAGLTGLHEDHGQWGLDSLALGVATLGAWAWLTVAAVREWRAPSPAAPADASPPAAAPAPPAVAPARPVAPAPPAAAPSPHRAARRAPAPAPPRAARRALSALTRPGRRAAALAAAACLAYGGLKLYWALGGELLLRETPLPPSARADLLAREPGAVASHWASVALALIGVALALATAHMRRAPALLVVGVPALIGVLMVGRAGLGVAGDLSGDANYAAGWDLALWSPFFAAWGAAWGLAALARRRAGSRLAGDL